MGKGADFVGHRQWASDGASSLSSAQVVGVLVQQSGQPQVAKVEDMAGSSTSIDRSSPAHVAPHSNAIHASCMSRVASSPVDRIFYCPVERRVVANACVKSVLVQEPVDLTVQARASQAKPVSLRQAPQSPLTFPPWPQPSLYTLPICGLVSYGSTRTCTYGRPFLGNIHLCLVYVQSYTRIACVYVPFTRLYVYVHSYSTLLVVFSNARRNTPLKLLASSVPVFIVTHACMRVH